MKLRASQTTVVIFIRSGSYVPAIRWRASLDGQSQVPIGTADELWVEGDGVRVDLTAFTAHANDPIASACAFGITDDLLHRLVQAPGSELFRKRRVGPTRKFLILSRRASASRASEGWRSTRLWSGNSPCSVDPQRI
jgi:hypothetical protein